MDDNAKVENFSVHLITEMYESFMQNLRNDTFPNVLAVKTLAFDFLRTAPSLDEVTINEEMSIIFFRLWQLELESLEKRFLASPQITGSITAITLKLILNFLDQSEHSKTRFLRKMEERLDSTYVLFSYEITYNPEEFQDMKAILLKIYGNVMRSIYPHIGSEAEVFKRMDEFCLRWSWGMSAKTLCDNLIESDNLKPKSEVVVGKLDSESQQAIYEMFLKSQQKFTNNVKIWLGKTTQGNVGSAIETQINVAFFVLMAAELEALEESKEITRDICVEMKTLSFNSILHLFVFSGMPVSEAIEVMQRTIENYKEVVPRPREVSTDTWNQSQIFKNALSERRRAILNTLPKILAEQSIEFQLQTTPPNSIDDLVKRWNCSEDMKLICDGFF